MKRGTISSGCVGFDQTGKFNSFFRLACVFNQLPVHCLLTTTWVQVNREEVQSSLGLEIVFLQNKSCALSLKRYSFYFEGISSLFLVCIVFFIVFSWFQYNSTILESSWWVFADRSTDLCSLSIFIFSITNFHRLTKTTTEASITVTK